MSDGSRFGPGIKADATKAFLLLLMGSVGGLDEEFLNMRGCIVCSHAQLNIRSAVCCGVQKLKGKGKEALGTVTGDESKKQVGFL